MTGRFIHISGYEELDQRLRELPGKVAARLLRNALAAGAQIVETEALARVPRRTGRLAETLRVRTSIQSSKGLVHARVIAGNGRDVFYAHMVEGGTKPHVIRVKRARELAVGGHGVGVVFRREVQHPGAKARPFMVPALEAKAEEAVTAVATYLDANLAEALT